MKVYLRFSTLKNTGRLQLTENYNFKSSVLKENLKRINAIMFIGYLFLSFLCLRGMLKTRYECRNGITRSDP